MHDIVCTTPKKIQIPKAEAAAEDQNSSSADDNANQPRELTPQQPCFPPPPHLLHKKSILVRAADWRRTTTRAMTNARTWVARAGAVAKA